MTTHPVFIWCYICLCHTNVGGFALIIFISRPTPTFKCSNVGKVMGKPFDIVEYGVCYIEDILAEIPEASLIVS